MEQVKKRISELESDAKYLERSNSSSSIIEQQLSSSCHKDGNTNAIKPIMDLSHDNLSRWDEMEGYFTEKIDKDAFDTQSIAQSVLSKAGQSTRLVIAFVSNYFACILAEYLHTRLHIILTLTL